MQKNNNARKTGYQGSPKTPSSSSDTRRKPKRGNPAGSRQQVDTKAKKQSKSAKQLDPRIGSKKPITLGNVQQKPTFSTPSEELSAIEADDRLSGLLDKLENDGKLTKSQQAYVDEKLARHAQLCEMLGLNNEEKPVEEESDLISQLQPISMEEFTEPDDKS